MPVGFLLINAGILVIMYSANKRASDEWLLWGIVSAAIITSGLAVLGNAYIHKVKSDLIRKQKAKEELSSVHER